MRFKHRHLIAAMLAGGGLLLSVSIARADAPAQARLDFAQAGHHFMFMQPKRVLHVDDPVNITLRFEHGAPVDADFVVLQATTS